MEIMEEFKNDDGNCPNLIYLNHRIIKNNQIQSVEKLNTKELFCLLCLPCKHIS